MKAWVQHLENPTFSHAPALIWFGTKLQRLPNTWLEEATRGWGGWGGREDGQLSLTLCSGICCFKPVSCASDTTPARLVSFHSVLPTHMFHITTDTSTKKKILQVVTNCV